MIRVGDRYECIFRSIKLSRVRFLFGFFRRRFALKTGVIFVIRNGERIQDEYWSTFDANYRIVSNSCTTLYAQRFYSNYESFFWLNF